MNSFFLANTPLFHGIKENEIKEMLTCLNAREHAQVSTTQNIYAHVIAEADERNADIISDIFLKSKKA